MKTIILDIDRTLVDSVLTCRIPLESIDSSGKKKEEWKDKFEWFIYDEYTVFLRPNIREFISFLFENKYNVGIFTAGSYNYSQQIVKHLFTDYKLHFVFSNREYDESYDMYGKLKAMEYVVYRYPELNLEECLLIDDSSRIKKNLEERCYNIKKFVVCYDNADVFIETSIEDKGLIECMEWLKDK